NRQMPNVGLRLGFRNQLKKRPGRSRNGPLVAERLGLLQHEVGGGVLRGGWVLVLAQKLLYLDPEPGPHRLAPRPTHGDGAEKRALSTMLRLRRILISSRRSLSRAAAARFFSGSSRTSARNCSSTMLRFGWEIPASAKMSLTPPDTTARDTIWPILKSSSSAA